MWPHMWYGGGWWFVMMMGMIIFWIMVFIGLYLIYRALAQRPASGPPPAETPRAILDRRLASGDISPDVYDALRRKLESGG